MAQDVSRSWFAVLNNPSQHGYTGTPQEVCEQLRDEWIHDSTTRSGAWAYCISAAGLEHVHMVLEDIPMRFSVVKASYAVGMHFEATKGTKQQAEDYIYKRHPFDEKGEQVLYIVKHGALHAASGNRTDIATIENMLAEGKNPQDIMDTSLSFRRFEKMIKDAYFRKRLKEVPPIRDVSVHYIVGDSGSGKSYSYVNLCQQYGESNICFISDYSNGGFDFYSGEKIIFLDEYKGQLSYSAFLTITDRYKAQVHARYTNAWALWDQVYITSVYPPERLYMQMVHLENRKTDVDKQLLRRVTDITYCFIDKTGNYCRYEIPMSDYTNIENLKHDALAPTPFDITP